MRVLGDDRSGKGARQAPADATITDAPKSVTFGVPPPIPPRRPLLPNLVCRSRSPSKSLSTSTTRTASLPPGLRSGDAIPGEGVRPEQTESNVANPLKDAIFKAIETRGHQVENERGSIYMVWLRIRGERIDFSFREKLRQRREPLSAEELKIPGMSHQPTLQAGPRADRKTSLHREMPRRMGWGADVVGSRRPTARGGIG